MQQHAQQEQVNQQIGNTTNGKGNAMTGTHSMTHTFAVGITVAGLASMMFAADSAQADVVFQGGEDGLPLGELSVGSISAGIGTWTLDNDSASKSVTVISDPFATGHGRIIELIDGDVGLNQRMELRAVGTAGIFASADAIITYDLYLPSTGTGPYNPHMRSNQIDNNQGSNLGAAYRMRDDRLVGLSTGFSVGTDLNPGERLIEDAWMDITITHDLAGGTFGFEARRESDSSLLYSATGLDNGSVGTASNIGIASFFSLEVVGLNLGTYYIDNVQIGIPEPSTLALLGLGALVTIGRIRRRR